MTMGELPKNFDFEVETDKMWKEWVDCHQYGICHAESEIA